MKPGGLVLITALFVAACANPKPLARCPALSADQRADIVQTSLSKAFGQRKDGYQVILDPTTTDSAGNHVYHLTRIAPALAEQPQPGLGGKLDVVVQPCTGKVVRVANRG